MTVADNTSRNQYTATSGQTVFAYTFEIVDKDDIVVLKNGTTLSEGTDYTVSNVGNDNGGNVTLTVGATTGDILTLYRDMPYSRTQNYTNSGDFLASEVNSDFDNLWLAGEQTQRSFSQSIRKPITDSDSISMELPEAASRAGQYLKFDNNGAVSVATSTTNQIGVNVKDYGAVGDGVTDDSAAIQAAADYCDTNNKKLCSEAGLTYYIESAIDLKGISHIEFLSDIEVDSSIVGVPVTVGGFATGGICDITFQSVTDGTSVITDPAPARPILRVTGMKSSKLQIGSCNYLQIYSDDGAASTASNAYNEFLLTGAHRKVELADTGSFSWITENRFYGGRIIELVIDGTSYQHNHNKFYDNTFEGTNTTITLNNAASNSITGARFENVSSAPGITFDADTYNNTVVNSWSGVGNPRQAYDINIPVSDSGENNIVTTQNLLNSEKITLFSVTPNSGLVSTGSDCSSFDSQVASIHHPPYGKALITPSLVKMSATSFDMLGLTGFIPVELGDVFGFYVDSEDTAFRQFIYIYDEDMKPITSEGGSGAYIAMPGVSLLTNSNRGFYGPNTNQSATGINRTAAVVRSEVKYIQLALVSYDASTFKEASAFFYSQKKNRDAIAGAARKTRTPAINGAPTQGYLPQGSSIIDFSTATSTLRYVAYSHESFVDGTLSSGATSVTVEDIDSVANGDIVGILLDDDTTHWTSVSSLTSSTFTIDAIPASRSVADQAPIVFNRWDT